jgi:hypothetical protein
MLGGDKTPGNGGQIQSNLPDNFVMWTDGIISSEWGLDKNISPGPGRFISRGQFFSL